MVLPRQKSGGVVRLFAVVLVVGMLAMAGLLVLPKASANFTPNGLSVAPSKYWGGLTFVPGETMAITMRTTAQDTMSLLIQNGSGTPSYSRTGIVMPATLTTTIYFTIPTTWPDSATYTVQATDTTSAQTRTVAFAVQTYRLSVWTNRAGYLVGDTVQVSWAATYVQNGTAPAAGTGAIQIQNSAGVNILTPPQYNFTASGGSFSFVLASSLTVPDTETIYAWFNDTTGARRSATVAGFGVGNLGITVNVQVPGRGYFEPGENVPVNIQSTITGIGGGVREPGVSVSVNVTDQSTGAIVAAYSNTGLVTDGNGLLTYVFQLAQTPSSGSYQVTATDTVRGSSATASAPPFNVRPPPSFTATVTLDKTQYISGDPITATANVVTVGPAQTYTYSWWAIDGSGNILAFQPGGASNKYTYTTSQSYQGTIQMEVAVNNQTGGVIYTSAYATVAFGYLTVTLDKSQFSPGDTINAAAHLSSSLITSPTYTWVVTDSAGSVVGSSNGTSATATFTTPSPASSTRYTFQVTATGNGRSVQASATSYRNDGFVLAISLDKSSYNPGDTMTITYTITAKGVSALPTAYHFVIDLYGVGVRYADGSSPTGTLTMQVPGNAPTGNLILQVYEQSTGASVYDIVHVGAVNPLVADVGGVPLFDILISLLFIVLLLAVVLLWRRTGMGRGPRPEVEGKPSTPPPPPPSGPSQQAAGPMSVTCKHCGASIEITTSKRPIEVMCPSCGETQVVQ